MFEDSIETRAETIDAAVGGLISTTPELHELFRRSDSTEKKESLRELLEQAVDERRSLIRDSLDDRLKFFGFVSEEDATKVAKDYIEMEWARTPWLTNYLAANLIAAVIGEGRHRLGWGKRLLKILPSPWSKIARALLSALFFLFLLALAAFLFDESVTVLGWVVVAFMIWKYIGGIVLKLKIRSFFGVLTRIAEEINSGSYDREETMRRLRKLDDDRLIRFAVPSLVYSLLRLTDAPNAFHK